MMRRLLMVLALVFFVSGLMLTAACTPKPPVDTDPTTPEPTKKVETQPTKKDDSAAERARAEAERQRKMKEEQLKRQREAARRAAEKRVSDLNILVADLVYFDYNSSELKPTSQSLLKRKAELLKFYPDVKAIIEGHCDERGTNEYNLALGERRADSVKRFLMNLGVDGVRLTTISYGEERPAANGHDEEAWSKNRRAAFLVE